MAGAPFDDRDGFIWLDGQLVPWRDARVHVLTHALHYASCVFEGERVYGGTVFKLTEHSERLEKSGKILGFDLPYDVQAIDDATRAVVEANGIVDGYVRPLAWRGSEMMGVAAQANKIHVAIACWLWPSYFSPEAKLKGLRLTIADWKRPAPDTAPTASKAAGLYMICTLSKHKAEAAGYDDALMFDYRGQVAEATGANIFFVKDGQLHTPKPDCFLDGITRRTVIDLARQHRIDVIERAIQPGELEGFEQAFLTGTAAEVTPLSEIGPYNFEVGTITKTLMTAYDDLVRGRVRE
ncbi:branched-chain amino acid aminotransferase [Zavarzinia compransoris]|uniref:Branched-chain-amino-acid aminotransferase n=1 Tax=Zavarzinia compransoris TaxID=1264899 RepID=A0A317E055_9PROT|nr:branched-chain amino acid aminotransferase [Zavarzinia compransoris]PWR20022.1 branched-chain amino acid aminotransferase [Zavarzinia compransoris]TDP44857.1 branched chain amino acid aminotransferase [Zavarzinia compransoris]